MDEKNVFEMISKIAKKIPSSLQKDDYQDVQHDFFLKVINKPKFQEVKEDDLERYLYTSFKNFLSDNLKVYNKQNKREELDDRVLRSDSFEVDAQQVGFSEETIDFLLNKIPTKDAELLAAYFIHNLSYKDIAQKFNWQINRVGIEKERALKRAKNILVIHGIKEISDLYYFNPRTAA
jgi:RNA polymerase sigma factor (sigma-70 family)